MEKKTNNSLDDIVSRLLTVDPYKIVLFGSLAAGIEKEESDIDLMVILDSETISQTYKERMEKKLVVRNSIREINKLIPIDLIVYTKAEYDLLQKHGTSILKGIESFGRTLYEKPS